MIVSFHKSDKADQPLKGARKRTRQLMVRTAVELMQSGKTPSVTDAAEAAGVSRATAYRYFPSQAALVEAVVDEGLGPILDWDYDSTDAEERVDDLLLSSSARINEFESTFRAALGLSLEQWARDQSDKANDEPRFHRGHRILLLEKAIEPLRDQLSDVQFSKLTKALSLTFGLEVFLVLKDIWGLDVAETQDTARWAARSLVRMALVEAQAEGGLRAEV